MTHKDNDIVLTVNRQDLREMIGEKADTISARELEVFGSNLWGAIADDVYMAAQMIWEDKT